MGTLLSREFCLKPVHSHTRDPPYLLQWFHSYTKFYMYINLLTHMSKFINVYYFIFTFVVLGIKLRPSFMLCSYSITELHHSPLAFETGLSVQPRLATSDSQSSLLHFLSAEINSVWHHAQPESFKAAIGTNSIVAYISLLWGAIPCLKFFPLSISHTHRQTNMETNFKVLALSLLTPQPPLTSASSCWRQSS